ncbi:peptidoglycan-associated lipoprotein Pal [candidate division TA06 bacterium]|uniref:Peptidoglycan-associated lipoprotein n=1 Tax=candidate division TA06 bacterium TaxID=2250710 RepID=A0A933ML20_UNCT6|nr:peptidoglycan-associated lipoprotein Pal [candidate division TA06 bacterium]
MKNQFTIIFLFLTLMMIFGCAKKQTVKQEEPVKQPEAAVPAPVAPPPAEAQPAAPKIEFKTVYFAFDSYSLNDAGKALLNQAGGLLRSYPDISLRLEGHCDERGTAEYNLALGEKRANAVREYLENLGVSRSRLSTVSFGKEKPAATGNDEASWARNRRVEIVPLAK